MKGLSSQNIDVLMLAFFNEMMIALEYTIFTDKFYISEFLLEN